MWSIVLCGHVFQVSSHLHTCLWTRWKRFSLSGFILKTFNTRHICPWSFKESGCSNAFDDHLLWVQAVLCFLVIIIISLIWLLGDRVLLWTFWGGSQFAIGFANLFRLLSASARHVCFGCLLLMLQLCDTDSLLSCIPKVNQYLSH